MRDYNRGPQRALWLETRKARWREGMPLAAACVANRGHDSKAWSDGSDTGDPLSNQVPTADARTCSLHDRGPKLACVLIWMLQQHV